MQDAEKETDENAGELNTLYEYKKVAKKEDERRKKMPSKKKKT